MLPKVYEYADKPTPLEKH